MQHRKIEVDDVPPGQHVGVETLDPCAERFDAGPFVGNCGGALRHGAAARLDDDEIVRETDNSWLVNGTANIREMNRVMQWELPTEGPKTLNGLILEYLERIPESGTGLKIEGYPIEIIETKENRVQLARVYSSVTPAPTVDG